MIGHRSTRGDVAALAARLEEQEARRAQLTRELAAFEERQKSMRVDPRRIERELRKRLADWRRLLGEHTPIARQMVLKMVDGGSSSRPSRRTADTSSADGRCSTSCCRGLLGQKWRYLSFLSVR
jgi:hypothetical protein